MVSRVAAQAELTAGGKPDIKFFRGQRLAQTEHLRERPSPQTVFFRERRPRRVKWINFDARPQARLQVQRVRLGKECDVKLLDGLPQESGADNQIPQVPDFDDEEFGFQGDSGWPYEMSWPGLVGRIASQAMLESR